MQQCDTPHSHRIPMLPGSVIMHLSHQSVPALRAKDERSKTSPGCYIVPQSCQLQLWKVGRKAPGEKPFLKPGETLARPLP